MHEQNSQVNTISLLSFNVFGSPFHAQRVIRTLFTTNIYKRFTYLANSLNTSDIDILALQEVNTYRQLFFLKKRLSNYPYVYYKRYLQGPKGGVVFFSRRACTDVNYVSFRKSGVYWNKSFIAHLLRRGLLTVNVAGIPATLVNTHLTHNLEHDWTARKGIRSIHDSQIAQIITHLNQKKIQDRAIVLIGDFNIPKDSQLFEQFVRHAKLKDVFEEQTKTTYHEEYTFKDIPLGRIDHIFLFPNEEKVKVLEKEHMFEDKVTLENGKQSYLSDHIGLYTKIKFLI
jgi:endonuclease/exonuclease/phosphatase family metal-dependent hydrolase